MNSKTRVTLLIIIAALIAGSIFYLESKKMHYDAAAVQNTGGHTADYQTKAAKYPLAPEIIGAKGFINTDGKPVSLSDYVGKKVILLDFWTYSCINCQRTLPYLKDWYAKYKDQGFVVIGMHRPEFEFEKDQKNVEAAVKNFGIEYPVVLDSDGATWNEYGNQYWPEHYLIDIDGLVVDRHIGEGDYAETEQKIQDLLKERMAYLGEKGTVPSELTTIDTTIETASPETYFGAARNQNLGNGTPGEAGLETFTLPVSPKSNLLYLGGAWNMLDEYAETAAKESHIVFKYNSKSVYFVAAANAGVAPKGVSITVLRDGKPVGDFAGADLDKNGTGTITGARLYKLIEEKSGSEHTLEIIIHAAGLDAFTFTFG